MAHKLKALHAYGPKLKREQTLDIDFICQQIASRSSLNTGEIKNVISELRETVLQFARKGHGIKIDGLGIYRPGITLNGDLVMTHIIDASVKKEMAQHEHFNGTILNKKNCGKKISDLVEIWNKEHPDDIIT